ncbi:hypothetical protein Clacol_000986 [Clathrus columnatus]|uniref:Uncharacterized protein n=1 Tax=Clathrus columnatus TaxID=1419009 RepID=A0AAV5A4G9_9AGAM|nr:hypothetical protein Clacol_000986 [Clathrus columnatus]
MDMDDDDTPLAIGLEDAPEGGADFSGVKLGELLDDSDDLTIPFYYHLNSSQLMQSFVDDDEERVLGNVIPQLRSVSRRTSTDANSPVPPPPSVIQQQSKPKSVKHRKSRSRSHIKLGGWHNYEVDITVLALRDTRTQAPTSTIPLDEPAGSSDSQKDSNDYAPSKTPDKEKKGQGRFGGRLLTDVPLKKARGAKYDLTDPWWRSSVARSSKCRNPQHLADAQDSKTDQKHSMRARRSASMNVSVSPGHGHKYTASHRFNAILEASFDELKIAIAKENWEVKGRFPPSFKPKSQSLAWAAIWKRWELLEELEVLGEGGLSKLKLIRKRMFRTGPHDYESVVEYWDTIRTPGSERT